MDTQFNPNDILKNGNDCICSKCGNDQFEKVLKAKAMLSQVALYDFIVCTQCGEPFTTFKTRPVPSLKPYSKSKNYGA